MYKTSFPQDFAKLSPYNSTIQYSYNLQYFTIVWKYCTLWRSTDEILTKPLLQIAYANCVLKVYGKRFSHSKRINDTDIVCIRLHYAKTSITSTQQFTVVKTVPKWQRK